jgi:hypothetical protein
MTLGTSPGVEARRSGEADVPSKADANLVEALGSVEVFGTGGGPDDLAARATTVFGDIPGAGRIVLGGAT